LLRIKFTQFFGYIHNILSASYFTKGNTIKLVYYVSIKIIYKLIINKASHTCYDIMFDSTMQSSRSGRKLNQAVQNTSRAVASTGKVVGMWN